MSYAETYLGEAAQVLNRLDSSKIEKMVEILGALRKRKGRLFLLGVGGGAGNASHAVSDFRKFLGLEAYTPVDNASELTARINDEGWNTVFVNWFKESRLSKKDAVLVFSVGGGNLKRNVSANIVHALKYAEKMGSTILGIVGRSDGYTAKVADLCIVIPAVNSKTVTPHTESFQSLIWHLIISHPKLKVYETKWESI